MNSGIACLYTKHKTQKKKTWHDGKLVKLSGKVTLYDEDGKSLDSKPLTEPEWHSEFPLFDFPKFLVEILDEVMPTSSTFASNDLTNEPKPTTSSFQSGRTNQPANSIGKFKKPQIQPPTKRKIDDNESQSAEAQAFTKAFTLSKSTTPVKSIPNRPTLGGIRRRPIPIQMSEPPLKKQIVYDLSDKPVERITGTLQATCMSTPRSTTPKKIQAKDPYMTYIGKVWKNPPPPLSRTVEEILAFLPK
ncbi:hypothetical protein THRCLA_20498 [Thraustotheca clavata]|uniref:5'-3' DNA helicase ZGRF1-like N-terminal domain-containing protein n=1 Tax=Thraustotheca clavata TaxID=74557 RepID=A0A1W0A6J0_9STRA|nr:hypothetical protein THRCLA_20498 [Thraustotheca clavata]